MKTRGELWNHGMAWDGRDLRAHPAPPLLWEHRPLQTLSKLALRTFLCLAAALAELPGFGFVSVN